MYNYHLLLILSVLFLFSGCTKEPPEFSNLNPVTITVTNNGIPVEGVHVSLSSKTPQSLRACSGVTNTQGVANIQTAIREHIGNGVEAGTYTVVLVKTVAFPPELDVVLPPGDLSPKSKEILDKQEKFLKQQRIIPEPLESNVTSPIELIVTQNESAVLTVDLSKY
ncbi:MAG: hypothetical protein LBE12_09645 [Planctomycetaceae bacterium]|nr:hypothetical protein [Planctomycetaceae bacterium]